MTRTDLPSVKKRCWPVLCWSWEIVKYIEKPVHRQRWCTVRHALIQRPVSLIHTAPVLHRVLLITFEIIKNNLSSFGNWIEASFVQWLLTTFLTPSAVFSKWWRYTTEDVFVPIPTFIIESNYHAIIWNKKDLWLKNFYDTFSHATTKILQ